MKYYTIQPPKSIADYVQYFWVLEGDVKSNQPFVHRALAEPCPELIFYYKGGFTRCNPKNRYEKLFQSGVFGQSKEYNTLSTDRNFGIFGVYLYPYTIPTFLSIPSDELTNQSISCADLFGGEGAALEENVILAADNIQRTKIISDFFIKKSGNIKKDYPHIINSIKDCINSETPRSLSSIVNSNFLSRRQFERKFKGLAGFSPNAFLSIVRFNMIIKNELNKNKSLTQVACDFGYYDQSHFIHDFIRYSGYKPKEYFEGTEDISDYRATLEFKS